VIEFAHPSEEFKRKNPHIFLSNPEAEIVLVSDEPTRAEIKSERVLQGQIVNLLRLKGIEVLWHRTDKRSGATVGWPDLTFSVEHGLRSIPCAWEIKLPGGKLSEEQVKVMVRMMDPPNAWTYKVITSVEEALSELRRYGIA
jgi:hypothetical protein